MCIYTYIVVLGLGDRYYISFGTPVDLQDLGETGQANK